jgi:hypothetical protein
MGLGKYDHLRNSCTEIYPERSASTLRNPDQSLFERLHRKRTAQCVEKRDTLPGVGTRRRGGIRRKRKAARSARGNGISAAARAHTDRISHNAVGEERISDADSGTAAAVSGKSGTGGAVNRMSDTAMAGIIFALVANNRGDGDRRRDGATLAIIL